MQCSTSCASYPRRSICLWMENCCVSLCLPPARRGSRRRPSRSSAGVWSCWARSRPIPWATLWLGVGPAAGPEGRRRRAHVDQIGLIVTYFDEHGYVFIDKIGGVARSSFPPALRDPRLRRGGARGGGKKPTHLIPRTSATERRRSTSSSSTSRRQPRGGHGARRRRRPRDVHARLSGAGAGVIATQALDDRAGVYCVIRALNCTPRSPEPRCSPASPPCTKRPRSWAPRRRPGGLAPAVTIVIDGDFCSDTPAADAKKLAGELKLGAGPVLGRGAGSNHACSLWRARWRTPRASRCRSRPTPGSAPRTPTNSWPPIRRTLSLSLAMRYMHSPFEVVHGDDLEAASRLVAALTRRIGEVWAARVVSCRASDAPLVVAAKEDYVKVFIAIDLEGIFRRGRRARRRSRRLRRRRRAGEHGRRPGRRRGGLPRCRRRGDRGLRRARRRAKPGRVGPYPTA